jgi:hypothetical protein
VEVSVTEVRVRVGQAAVAPPIGACKTLQRIAENATVSGPERPRAKKPTPFYRGRLRGLHLRAALTESLKKFSADFMEQGVVDRT